MIGIFLDTANLAEIEEIQGWGIIKGITTNQKIFSKEKGCNFKEQSLKILEMVKPYPVSLEGPNNLDELLATAEDYNNWGSNVVIKVPMLGNGDGIRAVKVLSEKGIDTNVTACMTLNQAFLAASAGATYVSLFYNRMKDWKKSMLKTTDKEKVELECFQYAYNTVSETMEMIKKSGSKTKLIVGSIRKPEDVQEIVSAGPHVITIPTKILKQMPFNEKTEYTLKEFDQAWEEFLKAEKEMELVA
ncbi:MAG: transaldolase family protein [Petrotogales bacterium]